MAEKLYKGDDLRGLPGLIRAEIDNARAALERLHDNPQLRVHQARQAIKRARSNARLLRKGDKTASKRINAAGRFAATILAAARDADSVQEIAHAAARECDDPAVLAALHREERRARDAAERIDRSTVAEQASRALDAMEAEVEAVRPIDDPSDAMVQGLARAWQRAVEAFLAAESDPKAENLHQLRKRAKDWRYHGSALEHVWPGGAKKRRGKTKKLTDRLGNHHDLSRLVQLLDDPPGRGVDAAVRAIDARREKLAKKALKTARTIFGAKRAETEKALN